MNKPKTNHCRFTGGSLITMASLAFALLMTMAQQALALNVAVLPSNSQNPAWGLVAQGTSIEVWGRSWDSNGAITSATLDFGDGSPVATLATGNQSLLGATHTYTTFGVKTVTLTVTDVDGPVSKTAKLKVLASPGAEDRINMAIEKGLLYLYKTQIAAGVGVRWDQNNWTGLASTGAAIMSFEENGHLPGNSDTEDIYAETVRLGLNRILSQEENSFAYAGHDMNGNGKAAYFTATSHAQYSNAFCAMAFFLSQPNAAAAQVAIVNVPGSLFNGMSYYDVGVDVLDNLSRAQSDNATYRGSWHYYVNTAGYNAFDGSTHQWPCLAFITGEERWGIVAPNTIKENAYYTFLRLQHDSNNSNDGAVGYSSSSQWLNTSKTGGILVGAAWLGIGPGVSDDAYENSVDRAIGYLGRVYHNAVGTGDHNGPFGMFYSAYGFKKGMALQGLETISTPNGLRDWYKDQSSWILGDVNLWAEDSYALNASIGGGSSRSQGNMFGQYADGRWNANGWNYGTGQMTSHAILILTQAVTIPLPVAIIATIGDAGEVKANEDFDLDGTQSYHQDGDLAIVSYSWAINAVGGANNPVATATGVTPTIGGLNPGEYQAVLTVTDNNPEEAQTSTDSSTFFSVNKNFGPQSVPIPSGQLAYTAQVAQGGSVTITLDGSESSDPEGDPIVSYKWDLDADGDYDDATGVNPTMTLTTAGSVTIALEVCSENSYVDALGNTITEIQCSTDNAPVLVIYSASDLSVTAISAANIVQGVSADLSATVASDATSGQAFTGVKVRFFDGDPDAGGLALAPAQSVDLPIGGSVVVTENGLGLNLTTELVWVKVDWAQGIATGDVDEWDESNNTASVNVSNQPPVVEWIPQGTAPDFSVGADCNAVVAPSAFYVSAEDPDLDELIVTIDPAGPFGLGNHTVTVTVSDGQESLSEDYSFTVVDTTDPVLSVPAGATLECPADTSVAANGLATATDNCSVTVTFADVVTAACGSTQTIARTWTATDGSGNAVTGLQVIEVVDTTDPVLVGVLGNTTVECDNVPAPAAVTATDTCDGAPTVVYSEVRTDGISLSDYILTRTWTATDACGNSSVATQVITVQDTTDPVLVGVPANGTVECDYVPAPAAVTATDICDAAPSVVYSEVRTDGNCPSNYTLTRTWTATDASGNSSAATQVITVQDTTNPVLAGVPADETVECDSVPAPAAVTATDNCDAPTLVFNEVRTDGDCPSNYTLTRTWTATDACGNLTSATQVVTVQDTTAPAPIVIDLRDIAPNETPITFTTASSDNCGGVVMTITSVTRHKVNKKGKITFLDEKSGSKSASEPKSGSKSKSLPAIVIDGGQVTINDAGGVGTIITVYATATDECGNSTDGVFTANVVKPAKSKSKSEKSEKSEKSKKSAANEGVGNGVDGDTPGHDNNGGNDDEGNTPGDPGAKKKNKKN